MEITEGLDMSEVQCETCRKPVFFERGQWKHENRNVYCGREYLYRIAVSADDKPGCDDCSRDLHACRVCGEPVSHDLRECESHGRATPEPGDLDECKHCTQTIMWAAGFASKGWTHVVGRSLSGTIKTDRFCDRKFLPVGSPVRLAEKAGN